METLPEKRCRVCQEVKPIAAYSLDRAKKDGRRSLCAACDTAVRKSRRPTRPAQVAPTYTELSCNRCGMVKPLEDFYHDKNRSDGHRHTCIACDKRRKQTPEARAQNRRHNNSERGKAAQRRYYYEGGGREKQKEYRERREVAERRAQVQHQSYMTRCRVGVLRPVGPREGQQKQTEQLLELRPRVGLGRTYHSHLRKQRLRRLEASLTPTQWQGALKYFGHACAYCGSTGKHLVQEHVVPLASGGPYTVLNIVPACKRCNGAKLNRPLAEWATAETVARVQAYFAAMRLPGEP